MYPERDGVSMSVKLGDVLTYAELCREEGTDRLERMNFQLQGDRSVLLLDAELETIGHTDGGLVFEGHNAADAGDSVEPKTLDQPMLNSDGGLSQNGLFFQAAKEAANGLRPKPDIRLYVRTDDQHWVYRGSFKLQDAWTEASTPEGGRRVFRFRVSI